MLLSRRRGPQLGRLSLRGRDSNRQRAATSNPCQLPGLIASLVIEVITHSSVAVVVAMRNGWPLRQPSPKNWPGSKIPTTASLPCSDRTVSLTLPFQDRFARSDLGENFGIEPAYPQEPP